MRLRKIPGIEEKIKADYPRLVVAEPEKYRGSWREALGSDEEIAVEIGMGRGRFIDGMSKAFSRVGFVGVEMRNEVIYDAGKRLGSGRTNVAVISGRAELLGEWFAPGEVSRIYLNFSDPWPKNAHKKRRLTHENYLKLYREILKPEGEIFVRTDARELMEFTLVEMTNHGFALEEVSFDFHQSAYFDEITTEYEERKSKEGPIYYARFVNASPNAR